MSNNALLCGIALIALGLFSFFVDAPGDVKEKAKAALEAKLTRDAREKDPQATAVTVTEKELEAQMEDAKKALADDKTAEARKKNPDAPAVDPATIAKVSMTALIPAAFGVLLFLCWVAVVLREGLRKHAMHAAALFAVLGVIGGLYYPVAHATIDWSLAGVRSGVLMSVVCLVFVVLAVLSFIEARREKAAAAPAA